MDTNSSLISIDEEKKEVKPTVVHRSPSVDRRILEHRLKVEDEKYKDTWESCCLVMDRRAVQYFTQIVIIGSTMAFSIAQLYRIDTCEGQQAYLGLLTLLIGILIPNPKFNDKV
tara:strand:- start:609 stop:950 length:342 start_codon:yes stop_codon:yes gene_type:complete